MSALIISSEKTLLSSVYNWNHTSMPIRGRLCSYTKLHFGSYSHRNYVQILRILEQDDK
jgi:hypothetical protein